MEQNEKLNKLYSECISELANIKIEFNCKDIVVKISKRAHKRYGCCKPEIPDSKYKKIIKKGFKFIVYYENYFKYTIEISSWVLELSDDIIKNTIIHELIHCLPKCTNHGEEFKKYAKIINEKLGYNITRTGNKKEDFKRSNVEYNEAEEYKYKIECKDCGQIYYRKRLNKNFIKKYRCGKCKGKLELI